MPSTPSISCVSECERHTPRVSERVRRTPSVGEREGEPAPSVSEREGKPTPSVSEREGQVANGAIGERSRAKPATPTARSEALQVEEQAPLWLKASKRRHSRAKVAKARSRAKGVQSLEWEVRNGCGTVVCMETRWTSRRWK